MTKQLLVYVKPKMLLLIGFAIIGLSLAGSYLYLFEESKQNYMTWQGKLRNLQRNQDAFDFDDRIEQLQFEIERLNGPSDSDALNEPASKRVAGIITRFDQIAEEHSVVLLGVTPGSAIPVAVFDELPFFVEVVGNYAGLFNWLYDVESRVELIVVKRFDIRPIGNASQRHMRLTIAIYDPRPGL